MSTSGLGDHPKAANRKIGCSRTPPGHSHASPARSTAVSDSCEFAVPDGSASSPAPHACAKPMAQAAVETPEPEIVIDGAPRRKVMRKQFPGTTTANGIEDAVEDLAAAVFWRPPTAFGGRHERYQ
jgi:hypothetical protein